MTIGPGIYHGLEARVYHADPCEEPSLSSSIAEKLLSKTPAHARAAHPRLNTFAMKTSTDAMDLGSVAHELLLGKGGGFEISPFDDYKKKAAQEWRDDTIARGLIPIKAADNMRAAYMAAAVHEAVSQTQGAYHAFSHGSAETVVIWKDGVTTCRAMIDWLDRDRLAIYDLKTTGTGISNRALQTKIASGLDLRAAFYLRGIETALDNSEYVVLRWVFVESEPPFECRVIEMDAMTRAFGDRKAKLAIEMWRQCLAKDRWPGYPRKIEKLEYPSWAEDAWLEREMTEELRAAE